MRVPRIPSGLKLTSFAAGTLGDIVLVHMGGSTRSMRLARLLLSILPILLTNMVATVVVSAKVWFVRDYL